MKLAVKSPNDTGPNKEDITVPSFLDVFGFA